MAEEPKWLTAARGELGVREVRGRGANPRVVEYFKASGHGGIISDETAWCSAFINWAMAKAGIKGTMALNARSWLKWGKECKGTPGAVVVFSRGNSNWQGHVGFWLGESGNMVRVIGGNQSDGVTVNMYPKSRIIGIRWPATLGTSRTVRAAMVGGGMTGATMLMETVGEAGTLAETAAGYLEWAKYVMMAITLLSFGLTVYFKYTDIKKTQVGHEDQVDEPEIDEVGGGPAFEDRKTGN